MFHLMLFKSFVVAQRGNTCGTLLKGDTNIDRNVGIFIEELIYMQPFDFSYLCINVLFGLVTAVPSSNTGASCRSKLGISSRIGFERRHSFMLSIPNTKMWNLASSYLTGNVGPKNEARKPVHAHGECSDDDASSVGSKDEGLECPICFESFNIVENVPYVLWCGHTMCKNCILGLQWAIVKLPTHPVQLPLFISCPWCNLLSFRLVFRGTLRFPRKNYFVLWMVERMNGERRNSPGRDQTEGNNDSARESPCLHHRHHRTLLEPSRSDHHHHHHRRSNPRDNIQTSLRKSLVFFVQLTAKFPLVVIFLLIILYAIPASAAILAMYILVTLLLALPSFLILYFAYPCLDWLVREIVT